jgi:subtilisin family serine protease
VGPLHIRFRARIGMSRARRGTQLAALPILAVLSALSVAPDAWAGVARGDPGLAGPARIPVALVASVPMTAPAWVTTGGRKIAPETYVFAHLDEPRRRLLARWARWIEPDRVVRAAGVPDDPDLNRQGYLAAVGAQRAWDVTSGSPSVVVAVLDTAVDATHPDLAGQLTGGGSFVTSCPVGGSAASHGTVVAGLIGAGTSNGRGISAMGWRTRVMPLQVLCDNGVGTESGVAGAIRFAVDNGAAIVNLSLAGTGAGSVLREAVAYAQDHNVLVVAAAGNEAGTAERFPAALPGVVAVGSSNDADQLAPFSNRGPWVDLLAPGVSLYSTVRGGGYSAGWTGTSFSAPLVAGAAALVMADNPGIAPGAVIERLRAAARPVAAVAGTAPVAWGRLDAGAAITAPRRAMWIAEASGAVQALGDAGTFATTPAATVALAADRQRRGFWTVDATGVVRATGWAGQIVVHGDLAGVALAAPVVGIAATPTGGGYWLVSADGGVFAFGDAVFAGSMVGRGLAAPVVGIAATTLGAGKGYWLASADGGVFAFGDAAFAGSMAGVRLSASIRAVSAPPGGGYVLMGGDGGVFSFAGAPFVGSAVGRGDRAVALAVL